jgi:alcohol dehydrogenase, propanol-preferring
MKKTMKAAVCSELRTQLVITDVPVPKPGPGDVLIKVTACGVCHSDVHAIDGDWTPLPVLPLIPGHEVAGEIAGLGEGVSGFDIGQRVGVPWLYSSCGHCEFCLAGMETICKSAEATGYSKPGGYAEYVVASAAYIGHLPDDCNMYEIAPILCAGVTTYRGLKRSQVKPGQWMAVVGIGGLGHIAVQYARAMGMRVAAVDVADEKLALAKSLGAEVLVNARETDPVQALQDKIGGTHGAVVTAVATRAFEQAIGMVRPAGTVVYIGIPGGKADEIRASIIGIVNGEISIRGSNVGTRADLQEAVDFAVRGAVKAQIRAIKLHDINSVFDDMRAGKIVGRVVIDMAGSLT